MNREGDAERAARQARAERSGFLRHYLNNQDFQNRFDEFYGAVERLPAYLIEQGRALEFPQLHIACIEGNVVLVQALLDAGLSADSYTYTEDEDDWTPLRWLARDEHLPVAAKMAVATVLLAAQADADEGDAVEAAIDAGDEVFADFLRASGS